MRTRRGAGKQRTVVVGTNDGFVCDWSPRSIMVVRGGRDSVWKLVHRCRNNSSMTINHRGALLFILEQCLLFTAMIDSKTLAPSAEIAPPLSRHIINDTYLIASTDEVLLLVRRRVVDSDLGEVFSYAQMTDISDHAMFISPDPDGNACTIIHGSKVSDLFDHPAVNNTIGVVHLKNPKPPSLLPLLQAELDGSCLHEQKLGESP
uniref:Uncharacterized protein n=1 Tax=Oryza punctata TaxID=4537 RepID=A0A0E0LC62_ORYPU